MKGQVPGALSAQCLRMGQDEANVRVGVGLGTLPESRCLGEEMMGGWGLRLAESGSVFPGFA